MHTFYCPNSLFLSKKILYFINRHLLLVGKSIDMKKIRIHLSLQAISEKLIDLDNLFFQPSLQLARLGFGGK